MRVGINYPWKNYGWDFGPPPSSADGSPWGPRAAWQATLDAELEAFRDLGIFALRWFILADGMMWGTGAAAPHPDLADPGDWRFDDPPPLSEAFLDDFIDLLIRVERAGLQLLPSIVDFHLCFPGVPATDGAGLVKGGRADVLNDPRKRARLLDGVLEPLLQAAAPYRSAVYAFELINEPEWCTQNSGMGREWLNPKKTVALPAMLDYLREGASRINAAGFLSTVGLFLQTVERWRPAEMGFTLHQLHYYGEPDIIPPHRNDYRWPLIVGELATAPHRPWAELPPGDGQTLYDRLALLRGKGYPAAFLWCASEETDREEPRVVDWSPAVQAQVRRFTHGK